MILTVISLSHNKNVTTHKRTSILTCCSTFFPEASPPLPPKLSDQDRCTRHPAIRADLCYLQPRSLWKTFKSHTLCCVATGSILHQNIVERLAWPIGKQVDPHGGDPLLVHSALWVPAVDDAVISRPDGSRQTSGRTPDRMRLQWGGHLQCTEHHWPLVLHDEANWILDLQVFRSASHLHLRCDGMFFMLNVFQSMLY